MDQGMRKGAVRILVADDFAPWRREVRAILQARPEWSVIGEAGDGWQAIQKAEKLRPDLVLLDIGMPGLSGIQAAEDIQRISPGSKIIFLTQDGDVAVRRAALAAGARGYVLKASAVSELIPAISAAVRNGDGTA